MNAITALLSRWFAQSDKALHAIVGAFLGFAGASVLAELDVAVVSAFLAVIWAGVAVAWGKERYDKAHPEAHTWDGWDAFATLIGVLLGVTAWHWLQVSVVR